MSHPGRKPFHGAAYLVALRRDAQKNVAAFLEEHGCKTGCFESLADFLGAFSNLKSGCVVLKADDNQIADRLTKIAEARCDWPVVVLTARPSIAGAVAAIKLGARDYLDQSDDPQKILSAVITEFPALLEREGADQRREEARQRIGRLTGRENSVFSGVLAGQKNKEIAQQLGISHRTVELHRASMMRRLGVQTVADLHSLANSARKKSS